MNRTLWSLLWTLILVLCFFFKCFLLLHAMCRRSRGQQLLQECLRQRRDATSVHIVAWNHWFDAYLQIHLTLGGCSQPSDSQASILQQQQDQFYLQLFSIQTQDGDHLFLSFNSCHTTVLWLILHLLIQKSSCLRSSAQIPYHENHQHLGQ